MPAILAAIVGGGLALLSWSQTWFDLVLRADAGAGSGTPIEVSGQVASPALAAFGLAGLALAGALAIAGPVIRIVLGVLAALLGGCVVLAAALTMGDPVAAVSPAVTDATGVAGAGPTASLVGTVTATFWPVLAFAGGALLVASGVLVLATGTVWPSSSRRYRDGAAPAFEPVDGAAEPESAVASDAGRSEASGEVSRARLHRSASDRAIDDWDELSRGDDPTG
ncbi:Trp biosynthesis-associated membrane protein [Agromyces protaetiae]|uniref:Trp biosynthesis-associated membrane protein n=1 Tax=Agromyces protaetiae TaxID=2509455 RepID=UPI0013EBF672|nr:Trp biosynthesis-associated membrane protein [Agromyces protaetiae]